MELRLEAVPVPVSDVDRARDFYAERAGFHLDVDRWVSEKLRVVQLTPPGSGCSIHLNTSESPGSLQGVILVVSDIEATQAELAGRGLDITGVMHFENGVAVPGRGEDWNSMAFFSDPDGNSWVVQERPASR